MTGKRRESGDDAAEMRRFSRRADDDLDAVFPCVCSKEMCLLGSPVRGNHPNLRFHVKFFQNVDGGLHHVEIRLAAHEYRHFCHIYHYLL